ncbi:DUF1573 domain-containing protein [Aureispira anguillae]|uniref:DUF1573 domain-containing protein n=1 Tax=Aureispira anguillae TaxID=2864201 RepID=A0A915YBH2_9BACT|nr:DUF1573 domain-containing protein [Aureispira anguillae]BDS10020.1 DUF1573 domain-containing protein [Aureispira anguillae]
MIKTPLLLFFLLLSISSNAQDIELKELDINTDGYTLLDFGSIKTKKGAKKELTLTNTGSKKLMITKIEEGCHCTSVRIKKKTLAPNQSTKIRLKWKPIDDSEFHSSIMIHSNAQNYPELWIQIEGNVQSTF